MVSAFAAIALFLVAKRYSWICRKVGHELREMIKGKEFDAVLLGLCVVSALVLGVCGALAVFVTKNPAGLLAFPIALGFLLLGLKPLWEIFSPYLR